MEKYFAILAENTEENKLLFDCKLYHIGDKIKISKTQYNICKNNPQDMKIDVFVGYMPIGEYTEKRIYQCCKISKIIKEIYTLSCTEEIKCE